MGCVERADLLSCVEAMEYHRAVRKQGTTTLLAGDKLGDGAVEVIRNMLLLNGSIKFIGAVEKRQQSIHHLSVFIAFLYAHYGPFVAPLCSDNQE